MEVFLSLWGKGNKKIRVTSDERRSCSTTGNKV